MPSLVDSNLAKAYEKDRAHLAATKLPIITVSGTFKEDAKKLNHLPNENTTTDVVLSRAHFSMALGIAIEAWGGHTAAKIDPKKAWMVDPTNYVSAMDWRKVQFTEAVGKTLARHPLFKYAKDFLDSFGRSKMPILSSITPPLLYLTEKVERPILSFHIAAGNILGGIGKEVIQMVTDPHVRPEYVMYANLDHMRYLVFDEKTKLEFINMASIHKVPVDPKRVIVTGPPVDPRIVAARHKKVAWRNGPVRLCITTGGLGTNKDEIHRILQQLLPQLRRHPLEFQILVYAGVQKDIAEMVRAVAKEERIHVSDVADPDAKLRLIYHPQILDANELLIKYGFPWADGFITKPSGDMAYDAAAAGCFVLTLQEWGVWEGEVRKVFEQKDISREADVDNILEQLEVLKTAKGGQSWIEHAMNHAFGIEKLFLLGSKKIVETVLKK